MLVRAPIDRGTWDIEGSDGQAWRVGPGEVIDVPPADAWVLVHGAAGFTLAPGQPPLPDASPLLHYWRLADYRPP